MQKLLSQISESDDEAKALEADIRHALGRAGDGKKGGGESGRRAKQPGEDGDRGEEDDDFVDRTLTAKGKGKGGEEEEAKSEKDLRKAWDELRLEMSKLEKETVPWLNENIAKQEGKIAVAQAGSGSLAEVGRDDERCRGVA